MNLLIIEDEPNIRKSFVKMIDMIDLEDFKVGNLQTVEYAEDAVPLLHKHTYELVFVDLKGGDMDGLSLIKKWHNKLKNTEWIIITGYERFEYAQEAISYGVSDYLLKPITFSKLQTAIKRGLNNQKKKQKAILPIGYIEFMIEELEKCIWELNDTGLSEIVDLLNNELANYHFNALDYNHLLLDMLKRIMDRLNDRGRKIGIELDIEIMPTEKEKMNDFFIYTCCEVIHYLSTSRKINDLDPIEVAKKYIEGNFEKEITLEEIANITGFNTAYFSQLFRRETGETFVNYRTKLRMERAKEILLRRDVRVIDIPHKIGMNDYPHFIKVFKKHVGLTPSKYRERMGVE